MISEYNHSEMMI